MAQSACSVAYPILARRTPREGVVNWRQQGRRSQCRVEAVLLVIGQRVGWLDAKRAGDPAEGADGHVLSQFDARHVMRVGTHRIGKRCCDQPSSFRRARARAAISANTAAVAGWLDTGTTA